MNLAPTSVRTKGLATRSGSGFTLIELMITVVIIGILASIAYPAFQQQVLKTRRSDAKSALTELANRQEKYFSQCLVYTNDLTSAFPVNFNSCAGAGLGAATSSNDNLYSLSATLVAGPPSSYVLTATAVTSKSQNNDTGCTVLTLSSTGAKTPTTGGCW